MTGTPQNPHPLPNDARRRASRARQFVLRVANYVRRRRLSPFVFHDEAPQIQPPRGDRPTVAHILRMGHWFVRMRWIACVVAAALAVLSTKVLGYLVEANFWPLAALALLLAVANFLFAICLRRRWLIRGGLELQILVDLLILTGMLHFSGGSENPASFTYVFHVIISGILLTRRRCYATVVFASVLFAAMVFAEMADVIEHYTLSIFPHVSGTEHGLVHGAHDPTYATSVVLLQFVLMLLTAYFTTTIMAGLRVQEQRASTERQRLQHVVQATGAGLTVLDRKLQPVWLNRQIRKWLDLPADLTSQPSPQLDEWTGGQGGPAAETFDDGKVRVVERVIDAPTQRHFQVTVAPLRDQDGNIYQVVELALDVTERKRIEAEMLHSANMATLGFMTAGIAHEVGNPLASISTRLRLLEEEHDEAFLAESLPLLRDQTERIGNIVRSVSRFARPTAHERSACRINDIIDETVKMLKFHRQAGPIRIVTELAGDLPATAGLKDQLLQVFLNLGLNALQAMPRGGTLTIRTCCRDGVLQIDFADTGGGMDAETRGRIFDPFFSTKQEGIGLGLSIARQLVDEHGGRIEVDSHPGRGTAARLGRLIAVVNEGATEVAAKTGDIITVPVASVFLTPILFTVPLQLLAYYIAVEKGTDVDQPRNLAKSVTVE